MEKNDENSLFSFIPQNSSITYKKIPLLTPQIKEILDKYKNVKNLIKPCFFYDVHTNQFIFINGLIIIILDTKCKIKNFSRIVIREKIYSISVESDNKYIICITYDYKSKIIDLLDIQEINYSNSDKGQYIGGFFIPHKNPQKPHSYTTICMISKTNFVISKINKFKDQRNNYQYVRKKLFVSDNMNIYDYNFNSVFKILLIIKIKPYSYCLYNLKSKHCYSAQLSLFFGNKPDIVLTPNLSKLYLRNLYKKLYLIHLNTIEIEIFRLNNLGEQKKPKKISINKNILKSEHNNINIQFYNNLIILYTEKEINIYDLKNKKIDSILFSLTIDQKIYENIYKNLLITGKYLKINGNYYKIKFLKENYIKYSSADFQEKFFVILRRNNSILLVKQLLYNLINEVKVNDFCKIIQEIEINYKKRLIKNNNTNEENEKLNAYKILYIGGNNFYLEHDQILSLFYEKFDEKVTPYLLIKILCTIYNICNLQKIIIDNDLLYSCIFFQLNKIKELSLIEFIIKNGMIPINEKLGIYLLSRSKTFNNKLDCEKCYNIGLEILFNETNDKIGNENENKNGVINNIIKEIIREYINEEKFLECIDLIYEKYLYERIKDH